MNDPFAISFSTEELIFLLRAMEIKTIAGLGTNPLAPFTSEQLPIVFAVTDRSLRARQIIQRTDRLERQISPTIVGILERYAQPQQMLTIQLQRGSVNLTHHFALASPFVIQCSEVDTDIFQFIATEGQEEARQLIGSVLVWKNLPGEGTSERLPQAQWLAARQLSSAGELRTLLSHHLSPNLATSFATALSQPDVLYEMSLSLGAMPEIVLIQGTSGTYLLTTDREQTTVTIQPTNSNDAYQVLDQLITRFLTPRDYSPPT